MLVLFDNGTPRSFSPLSDRLSHCHRVPRTRMGRIRKRRTADCSRGRRVRSLGDDRQRPIHQQNLADRRIAIVVLGKARWSLIRPHVPEIVAAINAASPGSYTEVEIPFSKMTPGQALEWLHAHPSHPPGTGNQWSREIRRQRAADAAREGKRALERR
jgi:hypothetical protein